MAFINQQQFDREDAALRASGVSRRLIGDRRPDPAPNGGIQAPAPKPLRARTRLVRFSGSSGARIPEPGRRATGRGGSPIPSMGSAGEWWLEWPEYKIVEAYAGQAGVSISRAVGLLCCVPLEWNDATVVIQAITRSPLLAFAGLGRPARGSGGVLDGRNPHGRQVIQLYIPGIASYDMRHDALTIVGSGFLPPG